jgi:hypothetical protein
VVFLAKSDRTTTSTSTTATTEIRGEARMSRKDDDSAQGIIDFQTTRNGTT